MNKKMFSLVLILSAFVLCMLSSLFIAFAGVSTENIGLEENRLAKQGFANVASSCNRHYSSLRGDGRGISITEAAASPAGLELYYDDGIAEAGYYWTGAGGRFAVRFTPPASGRLMECSFYIYNNPVTIKVRVLDANKNDVITPFPKTPTSTGWYHVDLSTYGITVSPGVDFYVAMESTVANAPSIGADESSPDGRSWAYDGESWSQRWDRDYMIRAVIETGADLKITDVYWEPSWPRAGDYVTFKAKVENQGNEDANDFRVELYLDEELTASGTFSLTAGANDTYRKADPWTATLGNHTVRWVIDATNVIDETNETNNEMSKQFMIGYYLTVGSPYGTLGGQGWYDNRTNAYATLDTGIVDHGNGTRRVFTHWSGDASGTNYAQSNPIYMDGPKTATANWKTQYYLTVNSAHGTPSGAGWCDAGSTAGSSVSSPVSGGSGIQYVATGYTGTGSAPSGSGTSVNFTITAPSSVTWNWQTQYYLTVSSTYGTPGGAGWYDAGTTANATVTSLTVSGPTGTQYVFTQWTGDASGGTSPSNSITMNAPKTATANWKTQYYLTMSTNFGTVTPSSGWYEAGSTAEISATAPSATSGEQYVWDGWTGTGSGSYSGMDNPASITMNGPVTETATWRLLSSSYIPPLTFSAETIEIGKTITVSGSITPVHEVTVTLTYTKPDGSTFNKTVTSSSDGTFSHAYKPDADGTWSVKASWLGDTDHYGATSETKEFTVKPTPTLSWDMLQVILAAVGIVLTVTIIGVAWASTCRKRSRIKDLIDQIDDAYYRYKKNARRCEAELYRLKDVALDEYKAGKIVEDGYKILVERIDYYIKELLEQNREHG